MTREQELIAEYEAAMNAPLSERDKELMLSVLKWADNHPIWHKADEELPPIDKAIAYKFSKKVLVSDGEHIHASRYNYNTGEWFVIDITVTHWMYLPELPKSN